MNVGIMSCDIVSVFFKQKTAYELRMSDWSSDVCSSDLDDVPAALAHHVVVDGVGAVENALQVDVDAPIPRVRGLIVIGEEGEGHDARVVHEDVDSAVLLADAVDAAAHSGPLGEDRQSVVEGKRVSVRLDYGGRRSLH